MSPNRKCVRQYKFKPTKLLALANQSKYISYSVTLTIIHLAPKANKSNTKELSEMCKQVNQIKTMNTHREGRGRHKDFLKGSELVVLSSSLPSHLGSKSP